MQFRAGGVFWCPQFPADAKWAFNGTVVEIDWGKYGQYVLQPQGSELVGSSRGNPTDWRKASFKRAFTPMEELCSGSAWMLHFENGVPFRVELRADGHFHCAAYPGASTPPPSPHSPAPHTECPRAQATSPTR